MAQLAWWRRAAQWIQLQDVVWLLLFAGMAVLSPTRDFYEIGPIAALAALQILEPKLGFVGTTFEEEYKVRPDYATQTLFVAHRQDVPEFHHF